MMQPTCMSCGELQLRNQKVVNPKLSRSICALRVVERLEAGAKLFAVLADNIPGFCSQEPTRLLFQHCLKLFWGAL